MQGIPPLNQDSYNLDRMHSTLVPLGMILLPPPLLGSKYPNIPTQTPVCTPPPHSQAAGYVVVWKRGQTWVGVKPTWATTRRPTMRSALPSQGRLNWLREDRLCQSESQSLPTPKPPSDGWPRRSLAPTSSTHSSQGSTSLHCCVPGQVHH